MLVVLLVVAVVLGLVAFEAEFADRRARDRWDFARELREGEAVRACVPYDLELDPGLSFDVGHATVRSTALTPRAAGASSSFAPVRIPHGGVPDVERPTAQAGGRRHG